MGERQTERKRGGVGVRKGREGDTGRESEGRKKGKDYLNNFPLEGTSHSP